MRGCNCGTTHQEAHAPGCAGFAVEYYALQADNDSLRAEVERLEQDLAETATALARREDPIIGTLLQDLVKDAGALSPEARRRLREQVGPGMAGRGIGGGSGGRSLAGARRAGNRHWKGAGRWRRGRGRWRTRPG